MANKKAPDGNRMNKDGTAQTLAYYPKPGDGPRTLPGKGTKPSKEEMNKIMKDRKLYGRPYTKPLPKFLQKLMPKKSGAGYSGD